MSYKPRYGAFFASFLFRKACYNDRVANKQSWWLSFEKIKGGDAYENKRSLP